MKKLTVIIPAYNAESTIKQAIESIPDRPDVEILVINDGSTDKTEEIAINTTDCSNVVSQRNGGVASAIDLGLELARGEYVVFLGSDDWFIKEELEKALDELDGTDLVYFDLEVNNGDVWQLKPEKKFDLCGSVKFMRREFIGSLREEESLRAKEDWFFNMELQKKNPTEKYLGRVVKHYNYPREGSLTDLVKKGKI